MSRFQWSGSSRWMSLLGWLGIRTLKRVQEPQYAPLPLNLRPSLVCACLRAFTAFYKGNTPVSLLASSHLRRTHFIPLPLQVLNHGCFNVKGISSTKYRKCIRTKYPAC